VSGWCLDGILPLPDEQLSTASGWSKEDAINYSINGEWQTFHYANAVIYNLSTT